MRAWFIVAGLACAIVGVLPTSAQAWTRLDGSEVAEPAATVSIIPSMTDDFTTELPGPDGRAQRGGWVDDRPRTLARNTMFNHRYVNPATQVVSPEISIAPTTTVGQDFAAFGSTLVYANLVSPDARWALYLRQQQIGVNELWVSGVKRNDATIVLEPYSEGNGGPWLWRTASEGATWTVASSMPPQSNLVVRREWGMVATWNEDASRYDLTYTMRFQGGELVTGHGPTRFVSVTGTATALPSSVRFGGGSAFEFQLGSMSNNAWTNPTSGTPSDVTIPLDVKGASFVTTDTAEVAAFAGSALMRDEERDLGDSWGDLPGALPDIGYEFSGSLLPSATVADIPGVPEWLESWMQEKLYDPINALSDSFESWFWAFRLLGSIGEES